MKKRKTAIQKAMNVIGKAIERDPDYRMTWEANIAMAFVDSWRWWRERNGLKRVLNAKERHAVANEAAAHFVRICWHIPPVHPSVKGKKDK